MEDHTSEISNKEIEAQYEQYLMPIWKNLNVPIERASDCTVTDFNGNQYLDLFSGISVTNAGHTNVDVVDAATKQLENLIHSCTYIHPNAPAAELGKKIAEITPGKLQKSFFCNSGTEAVEGAIKLARKYTGSKEILALEMAFHGRTLGSLALTGNKSYKAEMGPTLNDVNHVAPPYAYRCQMCDGGPCSYACADNIEQVIDTHTADDIAAIVVEPVMGEGGLIVPPGGWLQRVKDIAHKRQAVLIVDEVQTGYGRTGEMWGTEHFDVEPDIMAQAKGIANGLPLGAFTASAEIADAFDSGDHLSTFGGNPVTCAAALANIERLESEIIDNACRQGDWLRDQLTRIETTHDAVGEARGIGLMHGIELVDNEDSGPMDTAPAPAPKLAKHVANHLQNQGIIIGVGGFHNNVLRIQPPLTITRDQLRRGVNALEEGIKNEAEA